MRKAGTNRLFGTDGIRAVYGSFPLDSGSIEKISSSTEQFFNAKNILIGRDTRSSGVEIISSIKKGLSSGCTLTDCSIISTPGLAFLTEHSGFDLGIMISASHNSFEYNGIKIFTESGEKLTVSEEEGIEQIFFSKKNLKNKNECKFKTINTSQYSDFLKNHAKKAGGKKKLRIVIDCANGSSSVFAEEIFKETGHEILTKYNTPDGKNINQKCGSTFPFNLQKMVKKSGADIGIAFDGDADRLIISDSRGRIIDGDALMLILAQYFSEKDPEFPPIVVGTIMSNTALEKQLEKSGIEFLRSDVGDRNVYSKMVDTGALLGGEQSGHIIIRKYLNSGDGMLTAIMIIRAMIALSLEPEKLGEIYKPNPQRTISIRIKKKRDLESWDELKERVKKFESENSGYGRIIVRYSGTEPKIRIMVESFDSEVTDKNIEIFRNFITSQIGG